MGINEKYKDLMYDINTDKIKSYRDLMLRREIKNTKDNVKTICNLVKLAGYWYDSFLELLNEIEDKNND